MSTCTDRSISERLILALWPEENPDEAARIRAHVEECPACRKELAMLEELQGIIAEHRDELLPAVSPCPSPEILADLASGASTDDLITEHVKYCPDCAEDLELLRSFEADSTETTETAAPTPDDQLVLRQAVRKEIGPSPGEEPEERTGIIHTILSYLHVPSMALGAVAAAILVAVLVRPTGQEVTYRTVLADVDWPGDSQSMNKSSEALLAPVKVKKRTALVIRVAEGSGISQEQVRKLYEQLSFPESVTDTFDIIPPAKLYRLLSKEAGTEAPSSITPAIVLKRADADYLLDVRLSGDKENVTLTVALTDRSVPEPLAVMSQSQVRMDRLGDRIASVCDQLLHGALK